METQDDIKITEEDVIDLLGLFTMVPSLILKGMVSGEMNLVKSFEKQIIEYRDNLTDEEMLKIRKVLEMPVPELQRILNHAYMTTNKKQLKILANSNAEPFIEKNLNELEKVLLHR
jgi:hypothetical protein